MVSTGPNTLVRLERVTTMTPLGIRFWDAAADAQVTDGLVVTARPQANPGARPVAAFRAGSGVYAFAGLPGLREFEQPRTGAPDPAFPPPAAAKPFWIDVMDAFGRFLPVTFAAAAPTPGLFLIGTGGATAPPGFFLFPAASRSTGAGIAAVRADLVDADTGLPAAFAAVEVDVPGSGTAVGLADDAGRVAVLFPAPAVVRPVVPPAPPPVGSPPPAPTWPLAVRVRYAPAGLTFVPPPPPAGRDAPGPSRPELRGVLTQALGQIVPDPALAPVDQITPDLALGIDLVLRTAGRSELLVKVKP